LLFMRCKGIGEGAIGKRPVKDMTAIVRLHNYVNGIKFSAYEFIVAALVVAPFAVYCAVHNHALYATLSAGLIANFLVIVVFAVQSLLKHEESIGIMQLLNKQSRSEIYAQYPNLDTLTLILCVTLVIPFLLVGLVVCEKVVAISFKT